MGRPRERQSFHSLVCGSVVAGQIMLKWSTTDNPEKWEMLCWNKSFTVADLKTKQRGRVDQDNEK